MKKLKQLIVFCLVAVMALAFSACGESKELTSISVDSSAAKTEYTVGEEFSSDGIVVTANYSDSSTETVSSGNYTVDSSAYSSTTAGTYSIVVSYSGMSASYSVTVSEAAVVTTVKLSSISLNTDAATTLFYVGQDFDSTGLVVTANFDDNSTATVSLTDSDLTIDRSAYVKSEVGTYKINVYYTYGSTTKSANYSVEVTDVVPMAGLDIYADGEIVREITYTLSSENPSVLLSADDLTVYLHEILDSGTNDNVLTSSEYTVKYFDSNQNELTTEAQRTVSSAGIYQIWVYSSYTESAYGVTYEISSFVKVEIVNGLESLALDTSNTSAVYTQTIGASDTMSSTWTYLATYANGDVKTLTASDVTVSGVATTTAATGEATVSYTENGITKTVTVSYTVTAAGESSANEYSLSISELQAAISARTSLADKTALLASDFTGSNAFLTLLVEQSSNQYRTNNEGVIEIKGEGLSVTFVGAGTITISFASTGSTNVSSLTLIDADGNYVSGTSSDATVATNSNGTYYTVTGSGTYVTVTFTVSSAGTYIIATNVGEEGRGARISSIVMTDVY